MTAYQTGKVVPLAERNGAPRHDDEKTKRLIHSAVQAALKEHDRTVVSEIRAMAGRVEKGFNRLAESMEAFVSGDSEVAVAALTSDDRQDDLPSLPRFKASALIVYPLKASDIANQLGLKQSTISYLLNSCGLNWAARKPELWDRALYDKTKRRLWHHRVVEVLREVITDPDHPDRRDVTRGCQRLLDQAARQIRA